IDREVLPRISVSGTYYRRGFYRLEVQDNLLQSLDDWKPVTIYSPLDGTPITAYNLDVTKRGLVNTVDRNSSNSDLRRIVYNGVELSGIARLPRGANLFGGWS